MCENLEKLDEVMKNFKVKPYKEVEKNLTEAAYKTLNKLAKQANDRFNETANIYASRK